VGGTLDEPRAGADLRLSGVALAGLPFGDGEGKVQLADRVVNVSRIMFGPFSASAQIDLVRREATVDATLSGFGLDAISPPLARMAGGALDCTLHGSFPFDNPSGRLDIRSAKGARGSVELDAQGVRLELAREHSWRIAGDLRRSDGGYVGDIGFEVQSWHLLAQDLAGTELPVEGHMSGSAHVRLAPPRAPWVEGEVRELVVAVEGEEASLERPAHFTVDGSAVRLDGATLVGKRSNLVVQAARAADGALSGSVAGELPGVLLGLVWREAKPSGRVEMTGNISGTDSAPRFEGTARVTDGSLRIPGLPEPVTRINGVLEFIPEAVKLNGVTFSLLGGTGVCDGRIYLSPQLSNDLELHLEAVRWPLILGLTPILTGDVRVVGGLQNLSISGKAVLKRTVFRRDLDLQRLVLEQIRTPERVRVSDGAPAVLNISVDVPSTLEVETPLARVVGKGEIKVTGTTARYGVLGRLEALPGGELEFAGNRYELDRGTVTFTSPDRIEAHLDILAHTTVSTYEVTVGLKGTLDRLTPTFTSIPPLPEMDVISLVSTGRRADSAGQAGPGAVASSFLTDQLTGTVTRRARTLLDVDQMRVDPFAATLNGNPTARMTVVKQINRDWGVTVSTNLTSNSEEVITSRWRLAQGVYLEANREQDGSYSLEVKWQRRY
jgi:autotransporter translocation and assembly factor TamB